MSRTDDGVVLFTFGSVDQLNAVLLAKARLSLGQLKASPSSPSKVVLEPERGEYVLRCDLKHALKQGAGFRKHFAKASKIEEDHGKLVVRFDDKCEMLKHLTNYMARLIDLTLARSHFVSREKRATLGVEPVEKKEDMEDDGRQKPVAVEEAVSYTHLTLPTNREV